VHEQEFTLNPNPNPISNSNRTPQSDVENSIVFGAVTFAASNYKRFYFAARPAVMQHNLLSAMETTLKLYAKRMNPTRDQDDIEKDVLNNSMTKIQADAFKHDEVTDPSPNMTRPYKMMLMRRLCIFASVVRETCLHLILTLIQILSCT
jgi:hypothetical protein